MSMQFSPTILGVFVSGVALIATGISGTFISPATCTVLLCSLVGFLGFLAFLSGVWTLLFSIHQRIAPQKVPMRHALAAAKQAGALGALLLIVLCLVRWGWWQLWMALPLFLGFLAVEWGGKYWRSHDSLA